MASSMSEAGGLLGRIRRFFAASIRGQILWVLVALLFVGSISQALTFYFKSRSVTLEQLRGSYQSLGITVGKLSVYDLQFNRQGLALTTTGLLDSLGRIHGSHGESSRLRRPAAVRAVRRDLRDGRQHVDHFHRHLQGPGPPRARPGPEVRRVHFGG